MCEHKLCFVHVKCSIGEEGTIVRDAINSELLRGGRGPGRRLATGRTVLDSRPGEGERLSLLHILQDEARDLATFLYHGNRRLFQWGKAAGAWR